MKSFWINELRQQVKKIGEFYWELFPITSVDTKLQGVLIPSKSKLTITKCF